MTPRYTNKETGEAAGTGAGGFFGEDRTPPFMPIVWQDWLTDPHVREMNETMQGVFYLILLEQWQSGWVDYDPAVLARHIRAHDPRNVKKFLARWGHLFVCCECAGVVQHLCDSHATPVQYPCRYCAGLVLCRCKERAGGVQYPCSTREGTVQNLKLKNYSIDVKNGLRLGTTKPKLNGTKKNGNEENTYLSISKQDGGTPFILSNSTSEKDWVCAMCGEDEDGCECGKDDLDRNSPEDFCWCVATYLFMQLGFDQIPAGWEEDATPLSDKFTTAHERKRIAALILWAYGRPEDNFWRERTANMKAFVTHVLKGAMIRQFDEALTKPEAWTRVYFITADDGVRGRCPFVHSLSSLIRPSDEMIETLKAIHSELADMPADAF
jgi:hypothetical protein